MRTGKARWIRPCEFVDGFEFVGAATNTPGVIREV
jgi:hypothetical protein